MLRALLASGVLVVAGLGTAVGLAQADPEPVYANCSEVRAAGAAPIRAGDPGFEPKFDRDGDGIGCEDTGDVPDPDPREPQPVEPLPEELFGGDDGDEYVNKD
jgi:hypothetical protein